MPPRRTPLQFYPSTSYRWENADKLLPQNWDSIRTHCKTAHTAFAIICAPRSIAHEGLHVETSGKSLRKTGVRDKSETKACAHNSRALSGIARADLRARAG